MPTVRSQNGWVARPDTSTFTRGTAKLRGGTLLHFWAANDDVAVIFTDFIERYDKLIEKVAGPILDDWSYANRLIRGSTSVVSNHGSATAIDLNALKHPRKAHNTYSAKERQTLRELVQSYDGVLRHGEFYSGTIDGMHCEIDAGPLEVKRAADRIRARNAPKPTPPKENDVALSPDDIDKIAKRVWAMTQPLGTDPPQTPGGLLLTVSKRVAEANLEARAKEGVEPLTDALRADLTEVRDKGDANGTAIADLIVKVDAILAAVTPPVQG